MAANGPCTLPLLPIRHREFVTVYLPNGLALVKFLVSFSISVYRCFALIAPLSPSAIPDKGRYTFDYITSQSDDNRHLGRAFTMADKHISPDFAPFFGMVSVLKHAESAARSDANAMIRVVLLLP